MKRVLILCTGNSCRSQMAEAIWKNLGGDDWQVDSAGSKPAGYVHPNALAAIKEIGLPTTGLVSKSIDQFADQKIDIAVTVCDNAKEACPVVPGARMLHWPFDDPADATGSEEEQMNVFRRVRDEIHSAIDAYLHQRPAFSPATRADALKLIEMALTEDIGSPDLDIGVDCTTDAVVPHNAIATAAFVSRAEGIVCGVEVSKLALKTFAPQIDLKVEIEDGQPVKPGQTIAEMSGTAHDILTMERTCLNFMCRLSGISSLAFEFSERVKGTKSVVLDTRKTTPGWRRLEKYAVACGGGANHRMGLYDAIMLKDNHLAFYRSMVKDNEDTIPDSIALARKWINANASRLPHGKQTILQLEVDTLEQFAVALKTDCDIVLLDNMDCDQLTQAVAIRDKAKPGLLLEASGGVNLKTIQGIAETGVDRISVGAITHSASNFDIGLDWR